MATSKTVYEVVIDTDQIGPTGDGTIVRRFRTAAQADAFAKGRTYYGRPATVAGVYVSATLAKRWGF